MTEVIVRDNPSGQITMGPATRKLEPGEAGFWKDGGFPGLSCSDCRWFVQGECWQVNVKPEPGDYCDEFQPALVGGNVPSPSGVTLNVMSSVAHEDLYITRVAKDPKTGVRRWFATSSGTKKDAYGEYMTVDLFQDFVRRITDREPAPKVFTSKAWDGGNPYLGVAHYLDLDGEAIVGDTERVYIDTDILKAKGTFRDTPLAQKAFESIKRDIERDTPPDERVRISIAFVDFAHDHRGVGTFIRKTLADHCDMCDKGVGEKVYRQGHLVHLALTRRPAYAETAIELEERSMSTKRDDAASIVGDDLADELEKKAKSGLTARSAGIDSGAVVIKADEAAQLGDSKPTGPPEASLDKPASKSTGTASDVGKEEELTEESATRRGYLGGAMTLSAAETFLTRSDNRPVLLDSWGVLAGVLSNIAASPATNKPSAIREVLGDFQSNIDLQTAKALTTLTDFITEKAEGGETVETPNEPQVPEAAPEVAAVPVPATPEVAPVEVKPAEEVKPEEKHILDPAMTAFRAAYDKAMALPVDAQARLTMLQPAMDALGDVVLRSVHGASAAAEPAASGTPSVPAMTPEQVRQTVAEEIAPLRAMLEAALTSRAAAPAGPTVMRTGLVPQPRALRPAQLTSRSTGETPQPRGGGLHSVIRRSVGLDN